MNAMAESVRWEGHSLGAVHAALCVRGPLPASAGGQKKPAPVAASQTQSNQCSCRLRLGSISQHNTTCWHRSRVPTLAPSGKKTAKYRQIPAGTGLFSNWGPVCMPWPPRFTHFGLRIARKPVKASQTQSNRLSGPVRIKSGIAYQVNAESVSVGLGSILWLGRSQTGPKNRFVTARNSYYRLLTDSQGGRLDNAGLYPIYAETCDIPGNETRHLRNFVGFVGWAAL
jgi:hypothetical protein